MKGNSVHRLKLFLVFFPSGFFFFFFFSGFLLLFIFWVIIFFLLYCSRALVVLEDLFGSRKEIIDLDRIGMLTLKNFPQ